MWVWVEVVGIKKISPKFENEILMMMKNIREQKKKKKNRLWHANFTHISMGNSLTTALIQHRRLKTSFSPFCLFPQHANLPSQLTSAIYCTPIRLGSRQYPVLLIPGRFPYPAWHRCATSFHYYSFSALSIPFF